MRARALTILPLLLAGVTACNGQPARHVAAPLPVSVTAPAAPAQPAPEPSATDVYVAQSVDGLVDSAASPTQVQPQDASGSCHARGTRAAALPDPRCTPGALNPAVTQATLSSTICVSGWTRTVRPPSSVTGPEKLASMQAYGDAGSPRSYEYDHLVSLELGGAPNDRRNLWPEPGGSPNPKDRLENRLHALVCSGQLALTAAQHEIATDWVQAYRSVFGALPVSAAPAQPAASPAAAAPPAAPASHPASGSCSAAVSDPQPGRGGSETVTVRATPGATVRTVAH